MKVVEEAYQMVLELVIQAKEIVEERVRKLEAGVCQAKEEKARVQLKLKLQISKLQLKAQPSTPQEVKE